MVLDTRFISSNDLTLWTQHFICNPSAETCIFISGAGSPAIFWTDEFCQRITAGGFNVIRFDNRDIGLSDPVDWDENPYTIADLANDVLNILDAYDVDSAHVIGHSMGGIIAQWLAIAHAHRIKTYTSISVATCGISSQPSKEVMDTLMENQPSQNFSQDLPGFNRSWKILNGTYAIDYDISDKYTEDLYIRSKHKVGIAWHHIWCQQDFLDLTNKLPELKVPGFFIHGEADPLIQLHAVIKTQSLAPYSQLIIIPGMGHMIFNRAIEDIIAKAIIVNAAVDRYPK